MTDAPTARRKAIRLGRRLIARRRPRASQCTFTLGSQQPPANGRGPFRSSSYPGQPCRPSCPAATHSNAPHPTHPRGGQIPIEPAAHQPRFRAWRFSDACRRCAWIAPSCRRPRNLHNKRHSDRRAGSPMVTVHGHSSEAEIRDIPCPRLAQRALKNLPYREGQISPKSARIAPEGRQRVILAKPGIDSCCARSDSVGPQL